MQGRHLAAYWQQGMDADLWVDIWYTTFTTVRTAVLTPCIMLLVFTVLRLAGQRSLAEQTLFNKIAVVALGSLVGGAALRPNTPLVAVAIATVIIVGFSVAVNAIYMRGWIPGTILRPHPTLVWVDGEHAQWLCQYADPLSQAPGYDVSTANSLHLSDCHAHAGPPRS